MTEQELKSLIFSYWTLNRQKFRHLMNVLLFLGTILSGTVGYSDYLDLDQVTLEQMYNLAERWFDGEAVLPLDEVGKKFAVYSFTPPPSEGQTYGDVPTENGVPLFLIVDRKNNFSKIQSKYNLKLWGYGERLMSRGTFLVKSNDGKSVFYLKPQVEVNGEKHNTGKDLKKALAISRMLEKLFKTHKPLTFTFLRENAGGTVNFADVTYSYLKREKEPYDSKMKTDDLVIPLQALLGTHRPNNKDGSTDERIYLAEELAAKHGLTFDEWMKKEFTPQFANFIAEANFEFGLHPQAHTQNVMVRINRQTGKLFFIIRDLKDLMIDPLVFFKKNRLPLLDELRSTGFNQLNRNYESPIQGQYVPETFLLEAVMQGLRFFAPAHKAIGSNADSKYMGVFLKNYFSRYREMLLKIERQMSPISANWENTKYLNVEQIDFLIDGLIKSEKNFDSEAERVLGVVSTRTEQIVSTLLRGLFEDFYQDTVKNISEKNKINIGEPQWKLVKEWKEAESQNRVVYLNSWSAKSVTKKLSQMGTKNDETLYGYVVARLPDGSLVLISDFKTTPVAFSYRANSKTAFSCPSLFD